MASHFAWLGWLDSNQRMSAPKADALPLGDTPINISSAGKQPININLQAYIYANFFINARTFFVFYKIFL